MHGNEIHAFSFQHFAEITQTAFIESGSQSNLCRQRKVRLAAHLADQPTHKGWIFRQPTTGSNPANGGSRAAEIQVNGICLEPVQRVNGRSNILLLRKQKLIGKRFLFRGSHQIGGEKWVFAWKTASGKHFRGEQPYAAIPDNEPP
jgi:hypothetical protein